MDANQNIWWFFGSLAVLGLIFWIYESKPKVNLSDWFKKPNLSGSSLSWATAKPWILGLAIVVWAYFLPWKLSISAIQGEKTWLEVWAAITPITLFCGAGLLVIIFWEDLKSLAGIAIVFIIFPWLLGWGFGYDVPIFGQRGAKEKTSEVEVPTSGYWTIPVDGSIRVWLNPNTSRTYPKGRVKYTHVATNFEFVGDPAKPRRSWPTGMPVGEYKIINLEENENPFELKTQRE